MAKPDQTHALHKAGYAVTFDKFQFITINGAGMMMMNMFDDDHSVMMMMDDSYRVMMTIQYGYGDYYDGYGSDNYNNDCQCGIQFI